MPRATLKANQRIKKSEDITTLIRKGQAFFSAPYKIYFIWTEGEMPYVRAGFAVPKRLFGKAVMRNRLKRLTRECFRVQKQSLEQICIEQNRQLDIVFMYQKTQVFEYEKLYQAIGDGLKQIEKKHG